MHKRNLTVTAVILITAVLFFAVVSFQQDAQSSKKTQIQEDEATDVKSGQTTDAERAYSKEYDDLYPNREKSKLSERRKEIKNLGVMIGVVGDIVDIPGKPSITPTELLSNLSCMSDSIVIGYIKSKIAHLSEDETYVFTEYEFSVEDILKNNSISSIEGNHNIKVTRPGGLIKLDNRIITVTDERFKPLQAEKKYLLFLRFVPSANGYMVASPDGDFTLENKTFEKISKDLTPSELRNGDSTVLLNNVRNSISGNCKQNSKEDN